MFNPQVSIHATEGVTLMQKGKADEAAAAFAAGIAKDPRDLVCLLGLARVQLGKAQYDKAKGTLEKLLAVEPRHLEAQSHLAMLQDYEGDPQALDKLKAMAAHPKAGFFENYNLAMAYTNHNDDDGAEKALERAEKFSNPNPQVCFERGRIAMRRNQLDRALELFQKAADLSVIAYAPFLMIARVHGLKGEIGKAVQVLNYALKLAPKEPILYEEVYNLCMVAGEIQQAMKAALELCLLDPNSGRFLYLKGLAELANGDLKAARSTLESALELAPTAWEIKQTLARTYEMLKEPAIARSLLEEAHRDAGDQPGPANDLALSLMKEGKGKEAREALEPALAKHPEDPAVNLNMALALRLEGGNRERAIQCAKKAQQSPDKAIRDQAVKLLEKL